MSQKKGALNDRLNPGSPVEKSLQFVRIFQELDYAFEQTARAAAVVLR